MKKAIKHRIIAAWLLLAVFASPFVVKSAHACHVDATGGNHSRHDHENCPICHFFFSCFTGEEAVEEITVAACRTTRPATYREHVPACRYFTLPPRAPPVA
ncbi:MAG: hypothetical protein LBF09_02645 [Odoribacteraceae bacterium]|nr:hypothetical protein [Odoribacteraceae bacterium]